MPSVIADFNLDFGKMHPDVGVADPSTDRVWNWHKGNVYRRTVTINNTGISARTNYIQRIVWDTRAIHATNKTTPTFNDLRVYDSDGVTRLEHYVFAPNTPYTVILVRMSHTNNQVKDIFIEYGNPALENLESLNGVTGSTVMNKSTKILECWSLETYRMQHSHVKNFFPVHYWRNRARDFNTPINRRAFVNNMPIFRTATLSGLPTVEFDGGDTLFLWDQHILNLVDSSQISIFTLSTATTSLQRYQSQVRFQDDAGNYIISHWWDGAGTRFILSNDGGTSGLNTGAVLNQWNLTSAHWKQNTTTSGMRTYRNASLVAQRTSVNTPLPTTERLSIGSFNISSEYFQGNLACMLIFNEDLSTTDRQTVESLINAIYQAYGTHATVTIGSESTISSGNHAYISYSPFATWVKTEKLNEIGSFVEVEATATVKTMLEKTLAVGSNRDGSWFVSTEDVTSDSLSLYVCRSTTATTVNNIDYVNILRNQGSNNLNDLSKFYQDNLVSTDDYTSSDSDYIEFDFWCENATQIDLVNSYISFTDIAETKSFSSPLTNNLNVLGSNRLNKVRIKKSSFIGVGSPTWAFVSERLKVNIRTTISSQTVKYGYFKHRKNYEDDTFFDVGSPARLQNCVSSDLDATYYNLPTIIGRITAQKIEGEEVKIDIQDYVNIVSRLKFNQLDSFPSKYMSWSLIEDETDGYITNYDISYYTYVMNKILGLFIPSIYLDIDLDMRIGDDQISGVNSFQPNLGFFAINGFDTVGDIINAILKVCGGVLSFDSVSSKFVARNGYKVWDNVSGSLPTSYQVVNQILPYKSDSSESDDTYNYIESDALLARVNRNISFDPMAPHIGLYGEFYRIRPTIGSERVTIFIPAIINGVYDQVFFNQFYIDGWGTSESATEVIPNNSNIRIVDAEIIEDKLALSFNNLSGADRFFYVLGMAGDYLAWDYLTNWNGVTQSRFTATAENTTDSRVKGRKQYEIDPKYSYTKMNNTVGAIIQFPALYTQIVSQLNNSRLHLIEVDYDPNIRAGKPIKFRNKEGRDIDGFITRIDEYSNGEYSQTLTVRQIG